MPRVAFPDGTQVDFSDSMSSDDVNAAASKVWREQLAPQAPCKNDLVVAAPSWSGEKASAGKSDDELRQSLGLK